MYLIGAEHPHKRDAITLLERLVSEKKKLVTNTEVLQEILHRYNAIHKKEAIQIAFDTLYGVIDELYTVTEEDCLKAKDLLFAYPDLSSRDAVHAANMHRIKLDTILSFDKGFDRLPHLKRIG